MHDSRGRVHGRNKMRQPTLLFVIASIALGSLAAGWRGRGVDSVKTHALLAVV
ncbi:MAG: hypothetical protein HC882_07105 [Acidobacteria bacterium]|nr:hypothetical protein [Acidobacteriota bacterium]